MFLLFLDIVVFDAHILLSYTVISFSGSLLLCTDVMVIVGAYLWICSGSIQSSSAHTSAHIFLLYFLLFKLLIFFFKFSINLEYSSNSLFITDPKQEAMLTVMYKFFFFPIFSKVPFFPPTIKVKASHWKHVPLQYSAPAAWYEDYLLFEP